MRANNVVLNYKLEDVSISKAYSFPFEVSFSEIRKLSKGYVKLHWHDEIQISIVTKGSVEFIVGEKSYILKNGQAIFINTQRIHMAKSVGDEDCIYHSIMFNAKLLKMFPGSIIEQKYIDPVITSNKLNSIEIYGNNNWEQDALKYISDIINVDIIQDKGYELKIYIDLLNLTFSQKSIIGSGGYMPEDVKDVIEIMKSGKWDIESIITHEFSLDNIENAIQMASDTSKSLNVVIKF